MYLFYSLNGAGYETNATASCTWKNQNYSCTNTDAFTKRKVLNLSVFLSGIIAVVK